MMDDLCLAENTITAFVCIVAVLIFLLQIFLCFRAKQLFRKLLPVLLLAISTIVFSGASACVGGWDGMGLLFFALLSFGLMFVCGIGWAIWAIFRKRNR